MKKTFWIVLFSFFCLTLLVLQYLYFQKRPTVFDSNKNVAKISLSSEPLTLDPRKTSDGVTSQFFQFCFDGLTRRGQDGKIFMALAEDVSISEDKKTYTFKIREAYWSSGELITAYDFEKSWKRILDQNFTAHNPDYLFNIKNAKKAYYKKVTLDEVGIYSKNSHQFVVQLDNPDPYFLELVSNKSFFPVCQNLERKEPDWASPNEKNFVGCGPFVIKQWKPNDKIVLARNLYYWDSANVKLDGVELILVQDDMTQLSMFENGELDWIGAPLSMLPPEALSDLKTRDNFGRFDSSSLYYCCFNNKIKPLTNRKIRQALSMSIDRGLLVKHISQGEEKIALCLLPKTMYALHTDYFKDGDVEKAKELFDEGVKELGMTHETFPTLTFAFPNFHSRKLLAQAIQQQWKNALGINVRLQAFEWQSFLSNVKNRDYQICCLGRGTHHLDPYYFLSLFLRENQASNYSRWESKQYQKLVVGMRSIANMNERKIEAKKAEELFMKEMPIAPIFFSTNFYLRNRSLKNVWISPVGSLDFKEAYFEDMP